MSSETHNQPALLTVAPRFVVHNLEQALTFYNQLGFQTTYHDEYFAIVKRDKVDLHLNYYADALHANSVCWINVTNLDALYQQYMPTNAVQSNLEAKSWGFREFFVKDPFDNLIIFAEHLSDEAALSRQGG